jgi:hypothetical protein
MRKNKGVGGRVIVKKLLVEISPLVGWRYLKNVQGVIVERGEHEQYSHTSTGGGTHPTKHIIKNDGWNPLAIKLDDGVVDIEGNNIVVEREWDLKFLDYLPPKEPKEPKPIAEKQYLNAKKIIERYESQIK